MTSTHGTGTTDGNADRVGTFDGLRDAVGSELAVSGWKTITQDRINRFAEAVDDLDWMHVDEARAKTGPVGQTIAQGFLTLSLLTHFSQASGYLPDSIAYAFNYGLDKVRWMTPIPVGARIRNRTKLLALTEKGDGRYLIKTLNTIEIEGESKPAMVAEWLGLVQAPPHAGGPPVDEAQ